MLAVNITIESNSDEFKQLIEKANTLEELNKILSEIREFDLKINLI